MNEDTRSPSVPPEGSFGLQVPASAGSWEAGPARAAGGCRRVHQDVGGDAEEAGITPCPAREAAQGTASKTQGEGKCQQRAEAGPPLVVPALLLGRECPLMGTGCSLPSSVESTKTGASSSALPPDHGKDAQDEQGMDGGCWHCRTSELASKSPSVKCLHRCCTALSDISSRAAACAFQSSMPKLEGEGRKDSSLLVPRRRAFG